MKKIILISIVFILSFNLVNALSSGIKGNNVYPPNETTDCFYDSQCEQPSWGEGFYFCRNVDGKIYKQCIEGLDIACKTDDDCPKVNFTDFDLNQTFKWICISDFFNESIHYCGFESSGSGGTYVNEVIIDNNLYNNLTEDKSIIRPNPETGKYIILGIVIVGVILYFLFRRKKGKKC